MENSNESLLPPRSNFYGVIEIFKYITLDDLEIRVWMCKIVESKIKVSWIQNFFVRPYNL